MWDAFLLEGSKVLHRVSIALLRVAELRLLACNDQQEVLCALQEEQENCLDCERLLSLAFDKLSLVRAFSRGRIEALRRKHRTRLLAAEGLPMAPPMPPKAPVDSPQVENGPSQATRSKSMNGARGGAMANGVYGHRSAATEGVAAVAQHRGTDGSSLPPVEDDSSDEEGDDDFGDGENASEYDVVSHDDVRSPARTFWL